MTALAGFHYTPLTRPWKTPTMNSNPSMTERWQRFTESVRALRGSFFPGDGPIFAARAPGRLDVMGGIADYSGATVLELPLGVAAHCAVQRTGDSLAIVRSAEAESHGFSAEVAVPIENLLSNGKDTFQFHMESVWAAYVLGSLTILNDDGLLPGGVFGGFRFYIESDVPIGAGVSSSAAIEVASMLALTGALGIRVEPMQLARLCQRVENEIAGAPCGIMDQATSALGEEGKLLALDCRPHTMLGHIEIPAEWRFVGLNSGVKHSVGGSNYTRARISAFMGLRIVESLLGRNLGGYLCDLASSEWNSNRDQIPAAITGRAFEEQFGEFPDSVTRVDPEANYFPRAAAEHPVYENARVRRFMELVTESDWNPLIIGEAGDLMLESHRSYSDRVRLGSEETDLLVRLAMERGREQGLYGAKITGGGSGGTVAVLASGPRVDDALEWVRDEYARQTGVAPEVFSGSSPGAFAFGVHDLG